jgi:glycosyltransferase involved in cell wall biosynthesis
MRILHALNHTRRQNGNVHAAVDLACAQAHAGHTVFMASGGGDFDDLLVKNGVTPLAFDPGRKLSKLTGSMLALRRYIRNFKIDVVHAHMMASAAISFPVSRLSRTPLITTVHNEFEKSATLMGLGTRVIAVSDVVAQSMKRRGVADSKLRVVLNGTIGSSRVAGRSNEPKPLKTPSILFVGGLHPRKGLPDLLHAFETVNESHPSAHLYIIGNGPFRDEYEALAAGMRCAGSVTFVGSIADPYPYMLAADIFVLPSYADPAPLVLSEAREAGCAVLATAVDGIPQLLEHGEAGILVPKSDPSALAQKLLQLLASPGEIQEWKARSQLRIEYLSIDRVMRETMDVYQSALAGKVSSAG